jgi:3-isopropylmalate/(R)-2-methylmalate dehydratase small subunit
MDACRDGAELTVDLEAQTITAPDGRSLAFEIDPFARECILAGLDDIGLTLKQADAIAAFEASHPARVQTTALPA